MAVTSKKIAELAGVSRGTVDRALHNRGRVKPEVAERIKKIADELGYQPHSAAQSLALTHRQYKIGVYIQSTDTPTMKIVLRGIKKAIEELNMVGVETKLITNGTFDNAAEMNAIDELVEWGSQAIAITPTTEDDLIERVDQLVESGIPVVVFNGDIPNSKRMCYVGTDNYKGGKVAGYLLGNMIPAGGKVMPVTAHLTNHAHYIRAQGFIEVMQRDFPDIEVLPLQGCFDRDEFAYQITKTALRENPDIAGMYFASSGVHGAVKAIKEMKQDHPIKVISFDVEANTRDIRNGYITVCLDQHPEEEGYRSMHILYDYLAKDKLPKSEYAFTELGVVTKYSLD